jgi:hypothetical protein
LTKEEKIISFTSEKIKTGAIAQLGERLNGIQEVSGSIPLSSTFTGVELVDFNAFLIHNLIIITPLISIFYKFDIINFP